MVVERRLGPFTPSLQNHKSSKAGQFALIPYEFIGKMLHRPYRIYDVPAIKKELGELSRVWITKARRNNYYQLINGIEKLTHALRAAKSMTDLDHISESGLWYAFQKDMQKLRQELAAYFTPQHPEYLFATRLFDVEQRLEDELQSASATSTLRDREKDCQGRKDKGQCLSTRDCVWDDSSRWMSLRAPCQYRPTQRNQPLAYQSLRQQP
jgi:hypothetical protein